MATIPIQTAPTVEPTAGAMPAFQAPSVEPVKNYFPAQLEAEGKAGVASAANATRIIDRIQNEVDDLETNQRINAMTKQYDEITRNYGRLQGEAAYKGYGVFQRQLREARSTYEGGDSPPANKTQKSLFSAKADVLDRQFLNSGSTYADAQFKLWHKAEAAGTLAQLTNRAAAIAAVPGQNPTATTGGSVEFQALQAAAVAAAEKSFEAIGGSVFKTDQYLEFEMQDKPKETIVINGVSPGQSISGSREVERDKNGNPVRIKTHTDAFKDYLQKNVFEPTAVFVTQKMIVDGRWSDVKPYLDGELQRGNVSPEKFTALNGQATAARDVGDAEAYVRDLLLGHNKSGVPLGLPVVDANNPKNQTGVKAVATTTSIDPRETAEKFIAGKGDKASDLSKIAIKQNDMPYPHQPLYAEIDALAKAGENQKLLYAKEDAVESAGRKYTMASAAYLKGDIKKPEVDSAKKAYDAATTDLNQFKSLRINEDSAKNRASIKQTEEDERRQLVNREVDRRIKEFESSLGGKLLPAVDFANDPKNINDPAAQRITELLFQTGLEDWLDNVRTPKQPGKTVVTELGPVGASGDLLRPVAGKEVTSHFGKRGAGFHAGIDYKGKTGDPIKAVLDGTVVSVGHNSHGGHVIKLQHTNNTISETMYAHMDQASPLKVGAVVRKGDVIGLVGSSGNATGPHLHFEAKNGAGEHVNPANLVFSDAITTVMTGGGESLGRKRTKEEGQAIIDALPPSNLKKNIQSNFNVAWARKEATEAQAEKNDLRDAMNIAYSGDGNRWEELVLKFPALWARLKPEDQQKLKAGVPRYDEPEWALKLIQAPDDWRTGRIEAYRPHLSHSTYMQYWEKGNGKKATAETIRTATIDVTQFQNALIAAGPRFADLLFSKNNDDKKKVIELNAQVEVTIDAQQKLRNRHLTLEEKNEIINGILKQKVNLPGWFSVVGSTEPVALMTTSELAKASVTMPKGDANTPWFTGQEFALRNIPTAERALIVQALTQDGRMIVSEQAIAELYVRRQWQKTVKPIGN